MPDIHQDAGFYGLVNRQYHLEPISFREHMGRDGFVRGRIGGLLGDEEGTG